MAPTNPMHLLAAIVAVALFSTARAGLLLDADARGGVLMDGADRKWQDKSGNGKHCGLGTGVQWDAAHQSFAFNGKNVAICPVDIGSGSHSALTIEVWFKLSIDHFHGGLDMGYLLGHDNGGYDRALFTSDARYGGFGISAGMPPSGSRLQQSGLGYPAQEVWHHAVAVWDSGDSASFAVLDGKQGNYITARNGDGRPTFSVGGVASLGGHGTRGFIKRVRVWDSAYTTGDISKLYSEFKSGSVDKPVTTPTPGVSKGDLGKVDGRLAEVEKLLKGNATVTRDEVTEITKSLKEVVGVLADVKKAVTDQQTGFEARLKKLEDLYVENAIKNLVEKTDKHVLGFENIKQGLGEGSSAKLATGKTSFVSGDQPALEAKGMDLVVSAKKGTLTFEDEQCGAVDFCTIAEKLDKLGAAMEGIADKL